MNAERSQLPVVLAIGGHDPGGGAGIQADIESIAANGCHATTVVTCLTVQDSCNLSALHPVSPASVRAQIKAVMQDCPVRVIKIGLIGDPAIASDLAKFLHDHPQIPVVMDPVLAAGGGQNLATETLLDIIVDQLLPRCSLITPNSPEARRLCRSDLSLELAARHLLEKGAKAVLITGTHEQTRQVSNRLYDVSGLLDSLEWERLPGEYHGSGCTLASAIAAGLGRGLPLREAVRQAQSFTWRSLQQGFRSGRCQTLPNRLHAIRRLYT
ncbi:MAG: hydroxymethylpyrimidine/phosphomethylpyrimidine kinase [Chromatiales bacterium]|jgi:hydroxymethylpyrimidine/phosphomethylpyrimidine kinase